jgi:DNA-binding PadR family transcriptional regulator
MHTRALDRELKRGSAGLLILSLLDARPRHGDELSKLIHTRSVACWRSSGRRGPHLSRPCGA